MRDRNGFTLVEMLVATALVVLMMLLFAQVFQVATGLVSEQKGLANHDQDVRTLTILLRGDMGQRSFRDVVPFQPTSDVVEPDPQTRGFFSISENEPASGTDDVLHFTTKISEEDSPQLPFAGKTVLLNTAGATGDLLANRNQPEFDDGQLSVNNTGMSRYAEVCWFLRNGILYRRQLLIRDPYDIGETGSDQPTDAAGSRMISGDYGPANVTPNTGATGNFWHDFDYSAFHDPQDEGGTGCSFHTVNEAMVNKYPTGTSLSSFPVPPSLGIPALRFGNSLRRALAAGTIAPPPREFLDASDVSTYIGRFTIQETAHSAFTYPASSPGTGGPFVDPSLTLNSSQHVSKFSNETGRRGVDIVMTNVHSFDVQVWDDSQSRFVNLGNGAGDYGATANTSYGNRYDTWHPHPLMPNPPYRPVDASSNPKPLRAIQIQIRFFDVGSDSMRDLTFTFPLIAGN